MLRFLLIVFLSAAISSGCATSSDYPIRSKEMVVYPPGAGGRPAASLEKSIYIEKVIGGKPYAMYSINLDNQDLEQALQSTLDSYGFSGSRENAKYALTASILGVTFPPFATNMVVKSYINYMLADTKTGVSFYSETVSADSFVKFEDAYNSLNRMRVGTERSVRANIKQFVDNLIDHANQ